MGRAFLERCQLRPDLRCEDVLLCEFNLPFLNAYEGSHLAYADLEEADGRYPDGGMFHARRHAGVVVGFGGGIARSGSAAPESESS